MNPPSYHGINWTYHLTMVYSEPVGVNENRNIKVYLVYPKSFSFLSIIVFEKNFLEKDQRAEPN